MAPRNLTEDYDSSSSDSLSFDLYSNDINHIYISSSNNNSSNNNDDATILRVPSLEFKPRLDMWESPHATASLWQNAASSSSSPIKRRKQVTFGNKKTIDHIHLSELTPTELQATYYSKSDFRSFRDERQNDIDRMTNSSNESDTATFYGLENLTPYENFRVMERIRCARMAVLEEQDEQLRFEGYSNQDYIAARYSCYTLHCKNFASYTSERLAREVLSQQQHP